MQGALAQAEDLRRAGCHAEGVALLLDTLRYGTTKAQVLFRLGNLYYEQGDLTRAEYAYRRVTEEDPRHASAHHNLGVVYRRQGKISLSVRMLKKARRLELQYPRRVELAPDGRRTARTWSRRVLVLPLLIVISVVLLVWLLPRFT